MKHRLLSCIESRIENNRSIYGRFQLGPFQEGEGVTVANSLRRSLLSEITGLAITAVKIKGVTHEYSTLVGVRETVFNILLNLKEIVLTSEFKVQEPQIGYLHVQGPGVIKAKDLRLPSCIQCVDPEQHIATVVCNGVIRMKVMICKGKRYLSQAPSGGHTSIRNLMDNVEREAIYISPEQTYPAYFRSFTKANRCTISSSSSSTAEQTTSDVQQAKSTLNSSQPKLLPRYARESAFLDTTWIEGPRKSRSFRSKVGQSRTINQNLKEFATVLPIHAVFMPVNKVNFLIENDEGFSCSSSSESRQGKQSLDLIILEIWTNGSIHPRQAIYKAAKTLIELVSPFQSPKSLKPLLIPAKTTCFPLVGLLGGKHTYLLASHKNQQVTNQHQVLTKDVRSKSRTVTGPNKSGKSEIKSIKFLQKPLASRLHVRIRNQKQLMSSKIASEKRLSLDIGNLDLHVCSYTILKKNNIETLDDLLKCSSLNLLRLQGFTVKYLIQLENSLNTLGLKLQPNLIDTLDLPAPLVSTLKSNKIETLDDLSKYSDQDLLMQYGFTEQDIMKLRVTTRAYNTT